MPVTRFLLVAFLLAPSVAYAEEPPDKATCARSYESAQRLRRADKLRSARDELRICAKNECPAALRKDCVQWLYDVEQDMPSIVVVANAKDVSVTVDGEGIADWRSPIPLDPGAHVVRVESTGAPAVEERITLRAGDREHRIAVTFAAPAVRETPPPPPRGSESRERPVPTLTWVLGGIGLVGLGVGGAFQISGMSQRSDLDACAPRCASNDVDDARRALWTGNVVLGVSVVALAAAAIVYFTRAEAP